MPKPSAKVILDSISNEGHRITSLQILCHRFILAEINTHRMISKSFRSGRAVPNSTLVKEITEDPATPVVWMKNKSGMQATEPMSSEEEYNAREFWKDGAKEAVMRAETLSFHGLHKQWANRVVEPYMMTYGILTATEWENLFGLRVHPDAQPEFNVLAECMLEAMRASEPKLLLPGQWHTPYIDEEDDANIGRHTGGLVMSAEHVDRFAVELTRTVSAARCARVSYKVFDADRKSTIAEDNNLAHRLITQGHWGPFEHQATPDVRVDRGFDMGHQDIPELRAWVQKHVNWEMPHQHGNLTGWIQSRHLYPNQVREYQI